MTNVLLGIIVVVGVVLVIQIEQVFRLLVQIEKNGRMR